MAFGLSVSGIVLLVVAVLLRANQISVFAFAAWILFPAVWGLIACIRRQ